MKKLSKKSKYALFCELVEDVIDAATDLGYAQSEGKFGAPLAVHDRLNLATDKLYNAIHQEINK